MFHDERNVVFLTTCINVANPSQNLTIVLIVRKKFSLKIAQWAPKHVGEKVVINIRILLWNCICWCIEDITSIYQKLYFCLMFGVIQAVTTQMRVMTYACNREWCLVFDCCIGDTGRAVLYPVAV